MGAEFFINDLVGAMEAELMSPNGDTFLAGL